VLLLIAYGNSLRRDDGAGLVLAEQLAGLWQEEGVAIRHLALQQLAPELALEISSSEVAKVLFVDTACSDKEHVTLHPLTSQEPGRILGHQLTPESLLLYAQQLYGRCPPAWLLTIPGSDFGFGEGFSATTAKYLREASTNAWQLYRQLEGL
ncbi:MAG: hydrogenase maturation protease, partial [Caldilineaceae bacterium]|nr:hydrogenase maturation protease [Caldilineaceae bacterium]